MRLFGLLFFLMILTVTWSHADFHITDRPSFGFSGSGFSGFGNHWLATGIMPLKAIDGYAGASWIHDDSDDASRKHIRVRLEGGHSWDWFAIRGYGKYGRESAMLQEGLWHGGFNVEARLYEKKEMSVVAGLGTWAEKQTLLDGYKVNPKDEGLDFGPRAHLTLKHKHLTLNTEFLLNADKTYQVRQFIGAEIPLVKLFWLEQIYLAVSGNIEYYSVTKHISIDALQWNWRHELKWKF